MFIVNFLVLFGAMASLPRRRLRRHFLKLGILENINKIHTDIHLFRLNIVVKIFSLSHTVNTINVI